MLRIGLRLRVLERGLELPDEPSVEVAVEVAVELLEPGRSDGIVAFPKPGCDDNDKG
jgi:hypothetical protein